MRITTESNRDSSNIWINCKIGDAKDFGKIEKVAAKMVEYGYSIAHHETDEFIMLCGSADYTVAAMKEDYAFAKKES